MRTAKNRDILASMLIDGEVRITLDVALSATTDSYGVITDGIWSVLYLNRKGENRKFMIRLYGCDDLASLISEKLTLEKELLPFSVFDSTRVDTIYRQKNKDKERLFRHKPVIPGKLKLQSNPHLDLVPLKPTLDDGK